MKKHLHIEETITQCTLSVQTWISEIIQSVATLDCSTVSFSNTFLRTQEEEMDTRLFKLAKASLETMPKPIVLLLKALYDVKVDLVHEQVAHAKHYEMLVQQNLDSLVQYVHNCLRTTKQVLVKLYKDTVELSQNVDLQVQATKALTYCQAVQNNQTDTHISSQDIKSYSLFDLRKRLQSKHAFILNEMDAVSQKQSYALVDIKEPKVNTSKSLENANMALQTAEKLRKRLLQLNNSKTLQSTETYDSTDTIDTNLQEEEMPVKAISAKKNTNAQQAEAVQQCIDQIESALKSVNTVTVALLQSYSAQSSASTKLCTLRLQNASVSYKTPDMVPLVYSESLLLADKQLQKEIHLFLETLNIDKQSLEFVLGGIKAKCAQIQHAYVQESGSQWTMKLVTWKQTLQLALQELCNVSTFSMC